MVQIMKLNTILLRDLDLNTHHSVENTNSCVSQHVVLKSPDHHQLRNLKLNILLTTIFIDKVNIEIEDMILKIEE